MPNLDQTGPMGQGKLTGRGLGNCKRTGDTEPQNNFPGRGFGRNRGFGMGCQRRFGRGRGGFIQNNV